MGLLDEGARQRRKAMELGMYCLKFGLDKTYIEQVLHNKLMWEEKESHKRSKEERIPYVLHQTFFMQASVCDKQGKLVAYIYEDEEGLHALEHDGHEVVFGGAKSLEKEGNDES